MERQSAEESQGWLNRTGLDRIEIAEHPLEVASGWGPAFLYHLLSHKEKARGIHFGYGMRSDEANPSFESVKISHFDGSKLYQRGPLR